MTTAKEAPAARPPCDKRALTPQPPLPQAGEGEPDKLDRAHTKESSPIYSDPRPLAGEGGAKRRVRAALIFALLLLSLPGLAQKPLTVGSKRFTESYILGEIVRQVADTAHEGTATHKQGLGNTGIVFAALKNGSIDVYPEYTGTVAQDLLHEKTTGTIDQLNTTARPAGAGRRHPLGLQRHLRARHARRHGPQAQYQHAE